MELKFVLEQKVSYNLIIRMIKSYEIFRLACSKRNDEP